MMKRIGYILITTILWVTGGTLVAQTEDDFLNTFNDFKRQSEKEFAVFNDSINKQFAENLKKQWEEFSVFSGVTPPLKPKPIVPPKVNPDLPVKTPDTIPVKEITPPVSPVPAFDPEPRFDSIPDPQLTPRQKTMEINFYGNSLKLQIPSNAFNYRLPEVSDTAIADFWMKLNDDNLQFLIKQCASVKRTLQLNDWGVYNLTKCVAKHVFSDNQHNERTVFVVFLLNSMGYDSKIAYGNDTLYCLLNVEQQLYAVPFSRLSDKSSYFIFDIDTRHQKNIGNIYTYSFDYPNSTRNMDMNIYTSPDFSKSIRSKLVEDKALNTSITVQYNSNIIDFYNDYPQVEYNVYADAKVSPEFYTSIIRAFKILLKDKSGTESVSLLLNFMHYSFDYATDDVQFGYEKPLFCEENFYYPQNDCEDRALLFAFLVREILGLEVVLINYPDHVATAVNFGNLEVAGDNVLINNKKYVICDPTYIGASIGMSMPQYKNQAVEVIMPGIRSK